MGHAVRRRDLLLDVSSRHVQRVTSASKFPDLTREKRLTCRSTRPFATAFPEDVRERAESPEQIAEHLQPARLLRSHFLCLLCALSSRVPSDNGSAGVGYPTRATAAEISGHIWHLLGRYPPRWSVPGGEESAKSEPKSGGRGRAVGARSSPTWLTQRSVLCELQIALAMRSSGWLLVTKAASSTAEGEGAGSSAAGQLRAPFDGAHERSARACANVREHARRSAVARLQSRCCGTHARPPVADSAQIRGGAKYGTARD